MGRKPAGDRAMTATERKRRQYQRDKRAAIDAIGNEKDASDKALLDIMKDAGSTREGTDASARPAWEAFGGRRGWMQP